MQSDTTASVPTPARPRTLSSLLAQFAVSGLAAVAVLGVAGTLVLRHQALEESIRDARQVTELLGSAVIEPDLTDGIVRGDPGAVARLDRLVRARVIRDPVVRVKLWTGDGRIVYSDEHRLIGARYALPADERQALRTGGVAAELSDLARPENRFERTQKKLLEVYLPVRTPAGQPLLFEAYLRFSSVAASGRKVWLAFAPALIAALLLLWIVLLPLALSLGRRLRAGQREREALLLQAINASDTERRKIASDLHDGVVQDLAGISYSLGTAAERAPEELAGTLRQGATVTRDSMRRLRSLLLEIYPPALRSAGLEAALDDVVAPLRARGLEVEFDLEPGLELDAPSEQLVYRAAREALRNVGAHAEARRVDVRLRSLGRTIELAVEDDGRGYDADAAEQRRDQGHLGLRLLADRVADAGGSLAVTGAPDGGTLVRLELPS